MSDKSSKKNGSLESVGTWLVVKFEDEDSVEAVPNKWYVWTKDACFWPSVNCSRKKITEFIRDSKEPEADWRHYPATALGDYDDLATAQRKADKAKNTSDLSSNNEERYDRRPRSKAYKKSTSPRRKLSDIISNSDNSELDLDENDYPSTSGLGVKNKKMKDRRSRTEDHDEIKANEKRGTKKSVDNEPSNNKAKNVDDRSEEVSKRSTILLDNKSSSNEVRESEFQKQVLKEIHTIHLKLNDIRENLSLLIKNRRFENEPTLRANEIPDIVHLFPLNEQNLTEVEHWLEVDANNKKILAQELSRIGGSTTKEITRRIMYRVFLNEVGDLYSWEGAKKKKAFKKLSISSTILSAVRINTSSSSASEAEIIGFIKMWLVRCKDRMNNVKGRTNDVTENDNEARATPEATAAVDQPIESEK